MAEQEPQKISPELQQVRGNFLSTLKAPEASLVRALDEPQRKVVQVFSAQKDYQETRERMTSTIESAYTRAGQLLVIASKRADEALADAVPKIVYNIYGFENKWDHEIFMLQMDRIPERKRLS